VNEEALAHWGAVGPIRKNLRIECNMVLHLVLGGFCYGFIDIQTNFLIEIYISSKNFLNMCLFYFRTEIKHLN